MCRFLSKRILDWVLPAPFPMFSDRVTYLKALEEGRKCENVFEIPLKLLELHYDEAINFYKTLIADFVDKDFSSDLVVVGNEHCLSISFFF